MIGQRAINLKSKYFKIIDKESFFYCSVKSNVSTVLFGFAEQITLTVIEYQAVC